MRRTEPRNPQNKFLVLASVCVIVAALSLAREVLIPLALAVLFSFLLAPMVSRLERLRVPRVASVLSVVLVAFAIVAMIGWIVTAQLNDLAESVDRYNDNVMQKIDSLTPRSSLFNRLARTADRVSEHVQSASTQTSQPTSRSTTQAAFEAAQAKHDAATTQPTLVTIVSARTSPMESLSKYSSLVLSPLGTAGLVVVFLIFMLMQRENLRDRMIRLIGQGQLILTTQAIDDAAYRVSRYLVMQCVINGSFAICTGTGLWLIGIPNAFLWGFMCALLRFIPYVGVWIGICFPLLLSLAVFQDNWHFVYTIVLFVGVELVVSQFLEPLLYGSSTGMTPLAVLVSAVVWTWLWGPIGLLLSTPLTVVLVVIGKYIPQLKFIDVMLGDEPVLDPQMRYYQRLLAMDAEEAEEVIEEFLKQMPLEDVYDKIVIPALAMFEEDRQHGEFADEDKPKFILNAVREHIENIGEQHKLLEEAAVKAPRDGENGAKAPSDLKFLPSPSIFGTKDIHVLCLPASGDTDAVVAEMLAQVLEIRGFATRAVDSISLASEMVALVEKETSDIVCVAAIPPGAISHSRYLCKRIHARFPDLRMLVGLFGLKTDAKRATQRIGCNPSVGVVTQLCELITQLQQIVMPIKLEKDQRSISESSRPAVVPRV